MSETLEERLRVHANYGLMVTLYSSDIIELLDARDKIIAEQRAAIDEMRASDRAFRCSLFDPHDDNDAIELILLRRANAAQDSVLRRMQQQIFAYRRTIKGLCGRLGAKRISHDNMLKFAADCIVVILDLKTELVTLRSKISISLQRRMSLLDDLTKSELLVEGLRLELDALRAENAALRAENTMLGTAIIERGLRRLE